MNKKQLISRINQKMKLAIGWEILKLVLYKIPTFNPLFRKKLNNVKFKKLINLIV